MTPEEILALWREAGGDTHGPLVETACIPLDYLPQFVEAVRGGTDLRGFLLTDTAGKTHFIEADRTARNADELYGWTPLYAGGAR